MYTNLDYFKNHDEHISLNVFMHYNKLMKNIIDHIKEYGNLTLEEYPFNNVDSLILSQISYIKFENSTIDVESEVHLLNEFENKLLRTTWQLVFY